MNNINIFAASLEYYGTYEIGSFINRSCINFSTFIKTNSSNICCSSHFTYNHEVDHCNYIENTLGTDANWGVIYFQGGKSMSVTSCVFASNNCSSLFYGESQITVDKCYISQTNSYTTIYESNVTIKNSAAYMMYLSHFSNDYC